MKPAPVLSVHDLCFRYGSGERRFGALRLPSAALVGIDLAGATFVQPNFEYANLSRARMSFCDLRRANFHSARLAGADLSGTDLSGANLIAANLRHARLAAAKLCGAEMIGADLTNATLDGADLRGASISGAIVTGASMLRVQFTPKGSPIEKGSFLDLATTIGLEKARFSDELFVSDYLARAFDYAHTKDTYEATQWPVFLKDALAQIASLHNLYCCPEYPEGLVQVIQTLTAELISYLARHPSALHQLRPRQFEELIAEVLASFGWEVELTPIVKDGGYDILAIRKPDLSGIRSAWIVECKKYARDNRVGVDVVRALYGVRTGLAVHGALLATTSDFTRDAIAFKASRYDLELRDYDGIMDWIRSYQPVTGGLHSK